MIRKRVASIVSLSAMVALIAGCPAPKKKAGTTTTKKAVSQPAAAASQPAPANKETLPLGAMVGEKNGLKLYFLKGSPEFADAKLTMKTPEGDKVDGPVVEFNFGVDNYKLKDQTAAPPSKMLANSGKGQHIHLILNNAPYMAKYDEAFKVELEDKHYVALAFLSRSYHESVKAKGAFAISQFTVGKGVASKADFTKPHMFYSRPKGTYKGADAKRIMLDFYLVNATLSEAGMKVRATINGTEFMITKWAAYVVEGLPMGEVKIKLELLDKEGKAVPGPFNSVQRTVTLAES